MASTPLDIIRERMARRGDIVVGSPQSRRATVTKGSRPSTASRRGTGRDQRRRPDREQTFVARMVNQWWNRLLQSIFYEGSPSEQEAEYESHSTKRDYLWNTVGIGVWGMVFPLLTVVCTQLVGAEQAGMFSMAFVTGTLLMIAANYGVRNYQVSDIDEVNSFSSYQINRWITSILALVAGILYCTLRGYEPYMMTVSVGVYIYKMVDGLADVYEGRLQQADKLYLAGISQALRSIAVAAVFSAALFITRNLAVASVAMAVVAVRRWSWSPPLALLPKRRSRAVEYGRGGIPACQCFPPFAALFLFNLIESMPKFVMEGMLPP